jgi:hypothetical protein
MTVEYWLNTIEPPFGEIAISMARCDGSLSNRADSLRSALNLGFVWSESPQGYEFWSHIARNGTGSVSERMFRAAMNGGNNDS